MPELRSNVINIRAMQPHDAGAVAELCGELGYPVDPEAMAQRLQAVTGRSDHAVFVACAEGRVVGWIHAAIVHHVQADARAEIGGLVVAADARGAGIGAGLVARAEKWAAASGLSTIVVRSQIKRNDAHRFYEREGYVRTKTSAVFTKSVR